ncbi:MAG: pyridoxal phosphate-dependent aminotransferase [Bacteroidales bacterium]|jgi:aspartate aminotransferase|nr:pyridoxal phosphate-dependent aminotransferase [Bacteroidales bacterium]
MPQISVKGRIMPPSPIRKLAPYAEAAKSKGIKVYHLNIGQPDLPTPLIGMEAVRHNQLSVVEYSHSMGIESLRRRWAQYYQEKDIMVDHTQIMITNGGSEAISMTMMACLNHYEDVLVPEPFYANYYGFSTVAGIVFKPVKSDIEHDFAMPPVEELESLITPGTKAIMICNPNNPTGYLYSRSDLEKLAEIALRHDLFLISDEVYREFCYDGNKHYSIMQIEGLENHAVLIDSMSKRFSACGIRVGALVTRNKELMASVLKFAQSRLSPPSFGQILAEAALDSPPEYYEAIYNEYIERRNTLVNGLNRIPGVYSPMPKGAFYTMAKLPVDNTEKFAQWILSDFQYQNQTVMLAPGSGFYATPGLGKDEVRLAYVINKTDIEHALECLERALEVYPGRK